MLICTCSSIVHAQSPEIGASHMPKLNRTTLQRTISVDSALLGNVGANQLWDLRGAEAGDAFVSSAYEDPAQLGFGSVFNNSNYGLVEKRSDGDVQSYFHLDSTHFSLVGTVHGVVKNHDGSLSYSSSLTMLPTDLIYKFPLRFGNRDTSYSDEMVDGKSVLHISKYIHVDGYGTLLLPDGQHINDVLRVCTRSVYTQKVGLNENEFELLSYTFFQKGYHQGAICGLSNTYGIGDLLPTFRGSFSVGIADIVSDQPTTMFIDLGPQPCSDFVRLRSQTAENILSVTLYDVLGRQVHTTSNINSTQVTLLSDRLPTGCYRCVVECESHTRTTMLLVSH